MSRDPYSIVFLGLSLRSSWGNGHATTYRALLSALHRSGHDVTFLERDMPWYADNADLPQPGFCRLEVYRSLHDLERRHMETLQRADVVIVGSYVPEGVAVSRLALRSARGLVGFYDIDTPVTLAKLRDGGAEYLSADLVPHFDFYLSFAGGPCLSHLRERYGARLPWPFYCMVDPVLYRPKSETRRWDLGYLGTYSQDRQAALENLLLEPARRLPDRRFVVAGPQYPQEIEWPANVDRIEHVPPAEHARFYGRLRFALNLTRADMRMTGWSPSVRLFEAAACGTAIMTDRWDGIDSFFPPDDAILVVNSGDEVIRALTLVPPDATARLAARARRIVLRRHTGERRAQELEHVVRTAMGDLPAPARTAAVTERVT